MAAGFVGAFASRLHTYQLDLGVVQEGGEHAHGIAAPAHAGGHAEVVRAVQTLARRCAEGELDWRSIDETTMGDHLFTGSQPDPDLLIRTGGEHRLSNFLLWQASYAELYFTEVKWPDFKKDQLLEAIAVFNNRQRRFGKTGAQLVE